MVMHVHISVAYDGDAISQCSQSGCLTRARHIKHIKLISKAMNLWLQEHPVNKLNI